MMSSTFSGLNIMSQSLYTQQAGLNTVGHNIANANTDGYSRQTVNPVTTIPEEIYTQNGMNQIGTGVTIGSITRARNVFIDKQIWKESATLAYSQTSSEKLSKIEGVFSEPSDTGVQSLLNQFWTSWQTLSTHASDSSVRTVVEQRGMEVVNAVQHAAQQLKDLADSINSEVVSDVSNINQLTMGISTLNRQINNIEAGGLDHANDLRDSRDLLVDQLSKLVSISVNQDTAGNYTVKSGSVTLVDNNGYTKLSTETTNDPAFGYSVTNVVVVNATSPQTLDANGKMLALIDSRDSTTKGVKAYMTSLAAISQFLLQDFNAVHRAGYGTDNVSERNFFGADSTTDYQAAATMTAGDWINALKVNPEITASPGGLAIIAAKTAANEIATTAGSSNTGSGVITVSTTGTYVGGTTSTAVMLKVGSVDAEGNVSDFTYSTDGGTTWSSPPSATATIQGLTFKVNTSFPSIAPAVSGDTYNFTLSAGNNASGDNAILLGNRLKTDASATLGNTSLDAYYSSVIGALGVQSQDAQRLNTNQQTVVDQLTNLRQSVSGVSTDEEMTNMLKFQKGYNAAARVLTAMDEMLDKLINSTGVVGR